VWSLARGRLELLDLGPLSRHWPGALLHLPHLAGAGGAAAGGSIRALPAARLGPDLALRGDRLAVLLLPRRTGPGDALAPVGRKVTVAEEGRARVLGLCVVPGPFLVGVVLAFLGCCALGRLVSRHNPYKWFVRFHRYIHPETLLYPTASQVRALARERL